MAKLNKISTQVGANQQEAIVEGAKMAISRLKIISSPNENNKISKKLGNEEKESKPSRPTICNNKPKTPYKHIPHSLKPPEVVEKRNARERKRVRAVNEAFYRLRECVPIENRNKRVSKVKTLQRAIDYIRKLEIVLESDDSDLIDANPTATTNTQSTSRAGRRQARQKGARRSANGKKSDHSKMTGKAPAAQPVADDSNKPLEIDRLTSKQTEIITEIPLSSTSNNLNLIASSQAADCSHQPGALSSHSYSSLPEVNQVLEPMQHYQNPVIYQNQNQTHQPHPNPNPHHHHISNYASNPQVANANEQLVQYGCQQTTLIPNQQQFALQQNYHAYDAYTSTPNQSIIEQQSPYANHHMQPQQSASYDYEQLHQWSSSPCSTSSNPNQNQNHYGSLSPKANASPLGSGGRITSSSAHQRQPAGPARPQLSSSPSSNNSSSSPLVDSTTSSSNLFNIGDQCLPNLNDSMRITPSNANSNAKPISSRSCPQQVNNQSSRKELDLLDHQSSVKSLERNGEQVLSSGQRNNLHGSSNVIFALNSRCQQVTDEQHQLSSLATVSSQASATGPPLVDPHRNHHQFREPFRGYQNQNQSQSQNQHQYPSGTVANQNYYPHHQNYQHQYSASNHNNSFYINQQQQHHHHLNQYHYCSDTMQSTSCQPNQQQQQFLVNEQPNCDSRSSVDRTTIAENATATTTKKDTTDSSRDNEARATPTTTDDQILQQQTIGPNAMDSYQQQQQYLYHQQPATKRASLQTQITTTTPPPPTTTTTTTLNCNDAQQPPRATLGLNQQQQQQSSSLHLHQHQQQLQPVAPNLNDYCAIVQTSAI